jgi:hypothetical protein
MQPNVNIQATTNQYLAPAWVDQVLRDNFFFGHMMKKNEKWEGSQMLFPIKYQKGTASVAFNGFDLLPISQTNSVVNATFYPTFVATNVALAGSDLSVNKTKMQTLNLMSTQMKSRAQDGADDIGNFFQQDGSSFGGKAPAGLALIVDNGTNNANYGGLARATYSGLNATVTASGGTISLLKVRQLWNSVSDGPIAPDTLITDYTTWAYFEQLLTPFQRNNFTDSKNLQAGAGYRAQVWDGMEVYRDKKITTGYFYMLNTDYLSFYGLNWWEGEKVSLMNKDIQGNVYTDPDYNTSNAFTWTGWIRAYNQGAINGFMIMGGQLICRDPFRNGVLTGVTGV